MSAEICQNVNWPRSANISKDGTQSNMEQVLWTFLPLLNAIKSCKHVKWHVKSIIFLANSQITNLRGHHSLSVGATFCAQLKRAKIFSLQRVHIQNACKPVWTISQIQPEPVNLRRNDARTVQNFNECLVCLWDDGAHKYVVFLPITIIGFTKWRLEIKQYVACIHITHHKVSEMATNRGWCRLKWIDKCTWFGPRDRLQLLAVFVQPSPGKGHRIFRGEAVCYVVHVHGVSCHVKQSFFLIFSCRDCGAEAG